MGTYIRPRMGPFSPWYRSPTSWFTSTPSWIPWLCFSSAPPTASLFCTSFRPACVARHPLRLLKTVMLSFRKTLLAVRQNVSMKKPNITFNHRRSNMGQSQTKYESTFQNVKQKLLQIYLVLKIAFNSNYFINKKTYIWKSALELQWRKNYTVILIQTLFEQTIKMHLKLVEKIKKSSLPVIITITRLILSNYKGNRF